MNRNIVRFCIFLGTLTIPAAAFADDPPVSSPSHVAPPSVVSAPTVAPASLPVVSVPPTTAVARGAEHAADLARFRVFASQGDEPTRAYRFVGGLASLGVGALVTPVGAVLYSREPGAGPGIALGIGIASALGGAFTLLGSSSPYGKAGEAVDRAKALGHDDATALEAGEAELRKAAAQERLERRVGGGVFVGVGLAALAVGTTFALADFTGRTLDRHEQDGIAAALLVGGGMSVVCSLEAFLLPSPNETAWAGYSAAKRGTSAWAPKINGFGMAPTAGGGASAALSGVF